MASKKPGLPKTLKAYRLRLRLQTEGGPVKDFDSELMTQDAATAELIEHGNYSRKGEVVLDRAAVRAYHAEQERKREQRKAEREAARASRK